jgi:hypothetical protein
VSRSRLSRAAAISQLVDSELAPESQKTSPELWDILLDSLRAWDVRQVEFHSHVQNRPRQIRWIDPKAPVAECHWSLVVSMPGGDGEICELSAAAVEPVTQQEELAAITSLLTAFGTHFAAHTKQLFGPAVVHEEPAFEGTHPDRRRKAA